MKNLLKGCDEAVEKIVTKVETHYNSIAIHLGEDEVLYLDYDYQFEGLYVVASTSPPVYRFVELGIMTLEEFREKNAEWHEREERRMYERLKRKYEEQEKTDGSIPNPLKTPIS